MLLINGSVLGAMVDMIHAIAEFLNLFFAGVLAGEELVICYGVRTVVAVLDQRPQIELRHALIRKLRTLVPAIFILTALSGLAAMSLDGTGAGFRLRCFAALRTAYPTCVTEFLLEMRDRTQTGDILPPELRI